MPERCWVRVEKMLRVVLSEGSSQGALCVAVHGADRPLVQFKPVTVTQLSLGSVLSSTLLLPPPHPSSTPLRFLLSPFLPFSFLMSHYEIHNNPEESRKYLLAWVVNSVHDC